MTTCSVEICMGEGFHIKRNKGNTRNSARRKNKKMKWWINKGKNSRQCKQH